MRLPTISAQPPRSARPLLAGLALATAFLALPGTSHAQATKAAAPSGPPRPIAEFIPAGYDALILHVAGTEANEDAWKKTAAYKILNETSTGKMLEAVVSQAIDHYGAGKTSFRGAEIVQMIKHVFTKGAVVAASDSKGAVIVIRGVTGNKAIQGLFRRMTLAMNGANSGEKLSVVEGHKIVEASTGTGAARKSTNFWWIEETKKQDLVLTNNAQSAAEVLKVLDGQAPNVSESKTYQASLKLNDSLTPQITAVLDSARIAKEQGGPLLQFQMGFENDALLSVMKISAPKPHPGAMALLDQTPLDKSAYPALPEGTSSFSMMAVDLTPAYDGILDAFKKANPQGAAKFEEFANSMKTKARIKLKEDIAANLGPRAYLFTLPKAASSGGIASLLPGMAAGLQLPRGAFVIEVKDPVVVGKALDELILLANKELKTMTPPTPPGGAAAAGGPGAAPGGPGAVGEEGGRPGSRGAAAPTFEFKSVNATGTSKQYVLSMPPDIAKQVGSQLRPSIRLSGKQLVFGLTPDAARLAVEAKKPWTPPSGTDLVGAFPAKLLALSISDQTDATADLLATLPGKIQSVSALAALAMSGKAAPAPGGAPGAGGPPGVVAGGPPAAITSGGPAAMAAGGAVAPGGPPAAAPGGGRRDDLGGPISGGGGPGGDANANAAGSPGALTFQIPADLLPKPEDIKSKLFPTSFAVASDDQSVTILWRTAFVDAGDAASSSVAVALLLPAVQAARDAARRAAGLPPGPALSVPGGPTGAGTPPGAAPGGFQGQPGGAVAPGGPAGPGGARRGGRRSDID